MLYVVLNVLNTSLEWRLSAGQAARSDHTIDILPDMVDAAKVSCGRWISINLDRLICSFFKPTFDPLLGAYKCPRWPAGERLKWWQAAWRCRQAKILLQSPDEQFTRFALSLYRRNLRILVGLLTGYIMPNKHNTVMRTRTDSLYPVHVEEEETPYPFLQIPCYAYKIFFIWDIYHAPLSFMSC